MALVIQLQPGDKIVIGDAMFSLDIPHIYLSQPGGHMVELTKTNIQLVPEVFVRKTQLHSSPGLAVAITAPKDVSISRIRKEQVK
jgi:hypothetical protein